MSAPATPQSAITRAPDACGILAPHTARSGSHTLAAVLTLAAETLAQLRGLFGGRPASITTRIRGTGPGVSFGGLVAALERDHPIELVSPFEGSEHVAGAVWRCDQLLGPAHNASVAKLRWDGGADNLPMHVHEHSDRFIVVLEGRGFYHVSDQPLGKFDGSRLRTIAARERDVFCFTRGVVHTFSTTDHPMTLLSVQSPFLAFDDPRQYTLPQQRWTARRCLDASQSRISLLDGWTRLA